jgi:hypothetical protein
MFDFLVLSFSFCVLRLPLALYAPISTYFSSAEELKNKGHHSYRICSNSKISMKNNNNK